MQTTQQQIEADILELQKEEEKLLEALTPVRDALKEARLQLIFELHKVRPGVLVANRKFEVFKVSDIPVHPSDVTRLEYKPWVYGHKKLKAGGFSHVRSCVYGDWVVLDGGEP